jgi:cell division transport system permease protein
VGVITTDVLLWMAVSVLLFGLLITYLCAYLSINKYLRMRAGTLYYL